MKPAHNGILTPTQRAQLTTDAFWAFSLSHYKKEGVQQACLTLQDQYSGNVNLVLLFIWLDSLAISISKTQHHQLQDALSYTDPLLISYRSLRKNIKLTESKTLYQQALNFELQLEKQQQHDLLHTLHRIDLNKTQLTHSTLLSLYCVSLNAQTLLNTLHP